jgi:hypothetical protein
MQATSSIPLIPENLNLISLATVAMATNSHPDGLENRALRLGIELVSVSRGWSYVWPHDLDALVGAQVAASILRGRKPELIKTQDLSGILGCGPLEAARLCELRGVAVVRAGAYPVASRAGAVVLSRILAAERSLPIEAADWVDGRIALPQMRSKMNTQINGDLARLDREIDLSNPDAPREGWPWENELHWRCVVTGVRWKRVAKGRERRAAGPLSVPGFDLYRLLGIELATMDVERFRDWMAEATESVLGSLCPASTS